MTGSRQCTAFAPATVANVAVGFDVLGFAVEGSGDRVTARLRDDDGPSAVVDGVEGVAAGVPSAPHRNTAAVAARAMLEDLGRRERVGLRIEKGIPLSAGMGGSAASAVAAVVAIDGLLGLSSTRERLLPWALAGEAAASGAPHADNAAPCLWGGMTAALPGSPPAVISIPVPDDVLCVLVHPRLHVETRQARSILRPQISLGEHVAQSALLAAFVAGCCRNDRELIRRGMRDLLIEPQRSGTIPGFERIKKTARDHDALGCSIAGSGPSVFAWVEGRRAADALAAAIEAVFESEGLASEHWISPLGAPGAAVVGR